MIPTEAGKRCFVTQEPAELPETRTPFRRLGVHLDAALQEEAPVARSDIQGTGAVGPPLPTCSSTMYHGLLSYAAENSL